MRRGQPLLYLSPAAPGAAPLGLGLLLQLGDPGPGAPRFGAERLQLPGERVVDLGLLQGPLGGLQDRPPLLLRVPQCLLGLLLVRQTLALSPQLAQLGVSLGLLAQDSLRIQTKIYIYTVYSTFCIYIL